MLRLPSPRGDNDFCEVFKDEIESLVAGEQEKKTPTVVRDETTVWCKKNTVILFVLSSVVAVLLLSGLMVFQREHDVGMHAFELEEANDFGAIYTSSWNTIWEKADLPSQKKNNTRSDIITISSRLRSSSLNKSLTAQELFDIFPTPPRTDTIQIYNEEAYNELINVFLFKKKDNILICANGGSPTSGGGHIKAHDRYLFSFIKYISELNLNVAKDVHIAYRGHGTRHSLHSAIFASNFLPPQTDLLLWEFAINDYAYNANIPRENRIQQERSILIAWLREVEKMRPKPPKVVLVYLWKTPLNSMKSEKSIIQCMKRMPNWRKNLILL